MFAKEKSKIIFALILTISLVMGMGMNIPESEGSLPKYASKAADFYWNYYDEKVNFTAFSVGYDIINYTWDFGDGNIAYGYKTTHVYTISGNHTITLLMKKSDGDFITVSHYLNMLDGEPNVDFYWSPETPTTQEIVYFFDNSTDPDGYEDIYNWTWVFGDGSVAYGKNVTHRFADDGTYDVTLVIRDHSSGGNSATKQINVLNVPPITDFYWTREGNEIRFLDYSIDPDGSIVNWTWDFGDGNVSYEQNPLHNYSFDKTYTVKLTIRDDDNEKNESVKVIDFANPLPTADFTWVPDYPTILDVVSFIDLSTDDGSIVNWTWDFGDGNVSYEKNPSHQFSHKKTYVVTLTVIDNNHGLSSISKELEVVNAPPVADFSWDPYYPVPGEIINFTDKSYDSDGSIVNWTWDFGDGNVSYERNTSHAYTKNGTYTVNLTVKDDDGDISWKRKEMLVVAEIYVDDDAPLEWYDEKHVKTIQEGINNATNHAFIYVLEGIYKENVIVDKPVFLAAENAIVDASAMGNAFTFLGGDIEMNGFSIQNASNASGIEIRSDNNTIRNCTFMDNKIGIYIKGGNNNSIFQNEIKECGESFVINGSHDNLINETQIHDSMSGITIIEGNRNSIYDNTFSYLALYAIKIEKGIENEIFHNSIKFNPYGIMILSDVTCFLTENTFIQNGYGIFLMTNNIVVEKDVFIKNDVGIYISGNDTEVKECNFFDGIYGIKIENATDAYLHDCTFSSASTAIFTQNCSNVNISHSTLNGHNEGIRSVFSENVKIFNCTSWGNEKGMDIENSTATIHTSIFYSNFYGFFIINSSFSLTNSSLNENQCGIFGRKSNLFINHTSIENSEKGVASFSSHVFVNDTDIENNTYGITIENATFGECIFSSFKENEYGICFLNSSFISISNSSFSNNTNGMYGENSENITSMNNTFFFNSKGITMKKSHFCKLIDQGINFNIYGMELIECTNFIITDNKIRENDFGLIFSQSPKNKLSSNQFTNNTYNFDMEGLSTTDFYEDIDTSNKINGEPLYYLVNESNTFIEEPAGYIALVGCANISLANAMISNNGEGFLVVEGDNISIKNCTFKDNIEGSFILSSMNLIFNQTNVYNNLNDGILFQSSYDVSLLGCSIYQNGQRGINIYSLDEMDGGFSISGNEIKENWLGINIENTEGNLIQNNIIKNNGRGALRLFKASHTYIRDNNISANGYGIDIRECSDIYIFHDNLFSNENGIYLENSETRIQNSSFRECNAGIFSDASIINVENCTFFNNSRGMFLSNSSTHISLSSFINNTNGCEFISTSFNLSNSTLYGNVYGIISSYCTTGMIYCSRNIYGNEYAIVLNHSQNVNIFSCDVFNTTIGIYLINSLHNAIINCTIFNNTNGIVVINSTTNNISKCLVHHNSYGAKIEGDENTFYNNSFWKNDYGIWIDGGKHNTIYHNNFAYNTKNAHDNANNTWDNGYPSGGNYWSDYAGRDEFNGPHQNISGSDGIGDIPYKIGKSKDRYPLMELCEGAASIPNSPPIPSFMYYPRKPFSLEYVIFTDTSTDPNGKMDITTWHWDFGDGNTSDKQNPRHAYAHSGIYIITLTITDSYGEERNVTASIEIKNVPPTANFSWTLFSPNTQESVQF
ncbi:MAG: PKD domain-containing protein, partial [Thermoplasmata archaeon]